MIAVRFSSDEQAPSLYCKAFENHIVIGSEPLELSNQGWTLVPAGHLAKIKGNQYQIQALPDLMKLSA